MYRTRIKICGITKLKDVKYLSKSNIDAIGFVFYKKSKRYITKKIANKIIRKIPPFITTVGLFVNSNIEEIKYMISNIRISLLQFHGNETPKECANIASNLNIPFIRALRINNLTTSSYILEYEKKYKLASNFFSGLLLDTFSNKYGGSGKTFNWNIIPKKIFNKIILSGGLNNKNIKKAIKKIKPYGVDISSGVEKNGTKNKKKINKFIKNINKINSLKNN